MKKKIALWMVFVLLFSIVFPAHPAEAASKKNPITEIGIANMPTDHTIKVGSSFNFNPEVKATERKGKTTGIVYFEVNAKTNTAGVSSSRWGMVYPVYAGSFEIRALAFASAADLNAWKTARKENKYIADDAINTRFATAVSEWATIQVESETPGYAVARTQNQLNKALKNSECTDIHIITDKERTFTIPKKNYLKKTLTVDAPQAEIVNSGRFAQIEIAQIKTSTFFERAVGNQIRVTAPVARIVVDGGSVGSLDLAPVPNPSYPEPKIDVLGLNGTIRQFHVSAPGTVAVDATEKSGLKVGSIAVSASSNLSIAANVSSNANENAALPIMVSEQAGESKIETATRLEVNAHASIEVVVNQESDVSAAATVVNLLKAVTAMIGGTATDTIVNVLKEAAGATVESNTTVEIIASADVKISLTESAKDSVVKREEGVKVEASKDSTADVTVINPDGSSETVESGTENVPVTTSTPIPTPTTSASDQGSYIPSTPAPTSTPTPSPLPYVDHEMDWKDAVLEAAMREKTGIADRAIRLSDVYDMEEFEFTGTEEAELKNIEALGELVNLKKLSLNGNNISDISALKNLTKMEDFSIMYSPLESIEVLSAWKNLSVLNLLGCGITDISALKDLVQLTEVSLTFNEITDVTPLAGLKNLTQLFLGLNQITDISVLKDLTNLEAFTINMNVGITDISIVSGFKKLQQLSLYGLQSITDLTPLAGLTEMKELYLGNAPVNDLTPLKGMTKMEYLVAEYSDISDLTPLADMTEVNGLYLAGNPISKIDALAKMTKLEYLSLDDTQVGNIDVLRNMTKMKELSITNWDGEAEFQRITDISALSGMTELECVYLAGQQIKNQNLNMLKGAAHLRELSLDGIDDECGVSDISALEGKDLQVLCLNGHRVSDIGVLKDMVNLNTLQLGNGRYNNGISDISILANMTKMETLILNGNPISDLKALENMTNLRELYLSSIDGNGQIKDISALSGKNLEVLHLSGHPVSDLSPLSGAQNLRELYISNWNEETVERISDIKALAGKKFLRVLDLGGHSIADISPLADAESLEELYLSSTDGKEQIKEIKALAGKKSLRVLDLGRHPVADLSPLADAESLEELYLSDNQGNGQIKDIKALEGKDIKVLHLDGHQVSDLSPLNGAQNLRELRISNWNQEAQFERISDIKALAGKKFLEILDLGGHSVADISPLADAESLTELRIGGNVSDPELPVLDISTLPGKYLNILYMNDYWIQDTSPLASMGNLTELGICVNEVVTGSAVTTTFDQVVTKLGNLQTLDISRTTFKDLGAVLTPLKEMGSLNKLALRSVNDITDETLNSLCTLEHLTELDLGYNNFYDVNLSLLKNLKNSAIKLWLNDCWMNEEAISDETLADLRGSIPNLNPPRE